MLVQPKAYRSLSSHLRQFPAYTIWHASVYLIYSKWNTFSPLNSFENVQLRNNLCPQLFCSNNSHWHLLWEFVLNTFSKPKYYLSPRENGSGKQGSTGEEGKEEDKRVEGPQTEIVALTESPLRLVLGTPGGNRHTSLPMFTSPSLLFTLLVQLPQFIPHSSHPHNFQCFSFFLPMTVLKPSSIVLVMIFSNTLPVIN